MKKLSVIIPTLNEEKYIASTLRSLAEQSHKDFELIVKDGLSTDNTESIAREYADLVVSKKDSSIGDARNQGARYAKGDVLVWSPHYHVLGYIEGGYNRCRNCKRKWNCLKDCGGFDDRAWQAFLKDGYYVKVLGKRETVFGTAHYQLNHATIRIGIKRFHAVTWFGSCGNRKFKSEELKSEASCPVCGGEMVRAVYVGKRHLIKDVAHPDYEPVLLF